MGIEARKLFTRRRQEFIGWELEEHYLGPSINWDPIYAKYGLDKKGTELNLKGWIELFKKAYPLDSQSPEKKWGQDIFDFVAKELGLNIEEPEGLSFYSARGSGLDYRGIDCFFLFKNPETKKEVIFSIDLTAEEKKDEWKADKVLHEFPDWRSKEDEYIEKMKETAKQIAERLIEKSGPIH